MVEKTEFYRDTWAEVDLNAVSHNIREMKKLLKPHQHLMAVVKANGYGHHAFSIAKEAIEASASMLGVAFLDEGLSLRKEGVSEDIHILGFTRAKDVQLAVQNHLSITVYDLEWLQEAEGYLINTTEVLDCHLKIDTGMGRLGIQSEEELNKLLAFFNQSKHVKLLGIFTHFSTADEDDLAYTKKQQEAFRFLSESIQREYKEPIPYIHAANSAATLKQLETQSTLLRGGISMYGLSPSEEMKKNLPFELKQAFSLYSKLTQVKQMSGGESISYGRTYTAKEGEWIGTVPIGYADGWIRKNSGGDVLVNGHRCQIVGRICMDQMMIRLPYEVKIGEVVTIIGEEISVDEVAKRLDTINYEIPCMITGRVPRVIKKDGSIIDVIKL